jgi:predicted alpha/beta-hydrolase family hydrolase
VSERFEIVDEASVGRVSARFDAPSGQARASAFLLAHGAGFHMDSPWMTDVLQRLVERGFPVLAFNYLYRERALREGKEKPPDRTAVLESTHRAALRALEQRAAGARVLLAGKSLGGRIATHLAAKDEPCAGLVLFGYPLHPPGHPEKLRSEHFAAIAQPALFLQGTRDEFCDLELMKAALQRYGGNATLALIDGADHGFHVKRSSGRTEGEVLGDLIERVDAWERATFPA